MFWELSEKGRQRPLAQKVTMGIHFPAYFWNQVDTNKVVKTFLVFLHTINILWITQVYCVMVASLWIRIAGLHFSQVCPFQTNHVERTGKGTRSSRKPRPWRDVIEKKVVNSQAGHKNVMQYLYVSMSFCRAKNKI